MAVVIPQLLRPCSLRSVQTASQSHSQDASILEEALLHPIFAAHLRHADFRCGNSSCPYMPRETKICLAKIHTSDIAIQNLACLAGWLRVSGFGISFGQAHPKCRYGEMPGTMVSVDHNQQIYKWQTLNPDCPLSGKLEQLFSVPPQGLPS